MSVVRLLIVLGFFCVGQVSAQDDISVRKGDYEVFYSAFNSSFLKPDVARAVNVVRAKNKGVLNISVLKHLEDGTTEPAQIKTIIGNRYDLIYRSEFVFTEVVEPNAKYYLAPFKINNNNERIQFNVKVVPEGHKGSIDIKFEGHFYKD